MEKVSSPKGEKFQDRDSIVTKIVNDKLARERDVFVIPKTFRLKILQFAHDRSGHLGVKKTQELIADKFVWPMMGKDIADYCKSCVACQKANKVAGRLALMVKRPVVSEPFMSIAFDLIGPLPKGKGGKKYLLTYIDLSTRWPDAIPLCSITAKQVAQGMLDILSRTGSS